MNDRERLEEIKDDFNNDLRLGFAPAEEYENPMKWLIERVDELAKENYQAMTRVHALATIAKNQKQEYEDLREEKRYKKMFSKEKGKNIELEVKVQRMRLQIGREIT